MAKPDDEDRAAEQVTPELLRSWPLPDPAGSKKARGRVVVIGGSARTPGGVPLAGLSSLRVGAGHVQLAVASSVAPALAAAFPEAGVLGLEENREGSVVGTAAAAACQEAVTGADAVLVGPGLDDAEQAADLLRGLLPLLDQETALVLDSYALGVLPRGQGPRRGSARPARCSPRTPRSCHDCWGASARSATPRCSRRRRRTAAP